MNPPGNLTMAHDLAAKNEVLDSFMPQVQGGFAKKFGVWQFGT